MNKLEKKNDFRVIEDRSEWDKLVLNGGGHPLQLWGWGEVKKFSNWKPIRITDDSGFNVQVLIRPVPVLNFKLAYIARQVDGESKVEALAEFLKNNFNVAQLKIEPHEVNNFLGKKWKKTTNTILKSETYVLNLGGKTEDELLANMDAKCRQYIRKSAKACTVRHAKKEDLARILEIFKSTGARANFGLMKDGYYRKIFAEMGEYNQVLVAEVDGVVESFLWNIRSRDIEFELYGGMSENAAKLRLNYVLKWEAIRRAALAGVKEYDMNGRLNDGVGKFKASFGPESVDFIGTYNLNMSLKAKALDGGIKIRKKLNRVLRRV